MRLVSKGLYLIILIFFLVIATPNAAVLSVEEEEGIFGDEINIDSLEPSGEEITAQGNALAIYKGYHLEAETIYYNSLTGNIRMNGGISMRNEGYHLTGNKLTGNLNEGAFTAIGDVELTGVELNKEYNLTGNKLTGNFYEKSFTVIGDVELIGTELDEEYHLTGNKLTGNLNEGAFTVIGDVKLTGTDILLTGEELSYDNKTEEVIVKGRPYLEYQDSEYQNIRVRADHISYHIKKKLAYLTGNVSGEQRGNDGEQLLNSFSGEKMKANLKTKKMTLKGKAHLVYDNKGE